MNSGSYRPMEFVVGDLVYYTGVLYTSDRPRVGERDDSKRVGIVINVSTMAFHTYSVYWLKDQLVSNHVANHLELVYNV